MPIFHGSGSSNSTGHVAMGIVNNCKEHTCCAGDHPKEIVISGNVILTDVLVLVNKYDGNDLNDPRLFLYCEFRLWES